jgi:hypothetical protein
VTGACADHAVDVAKTPRPDRSACRVLCRDVDSDADMSKAVLNLVLDADDKLITTESLLHVAATLTISFPGMHNLRFRLRASLRTYFTTVSSSSSV